MATLKEKTTVLFNQRWQASDGEFTNGLALAKRMLRLGVIKSLDGLLESEVGFVLKTGVSAYERLECNSTFDPLNPPHYCPDHATAHGILGEVQTELDLIEEGQEAADNYTAQQVQEIREWVVLAREYQRAQ